MVKWNKEGCVVVELLKNKSKRKTIGKMTQDRGAMPPPTQKDTIKTRKNNRKKIKEKLRNGNYDAV